jgi:hypothetical protein
VNIVNNATTIGAFTSSGLSVTGTVIATSQLNANNGSGWIGMNVGDATHTGYIQFYAANGNRQGYMGYANTNVSGDAGTLVYVAGTHAFSGAITASGGFTTTSNAISSVLGNDGSSTVVGSSSNHTTKIWVNSTAVATFNGAGLIATGTTSGAAAYIGNWAAGGAYAVFANNAVAGTTGSYAVLQDNTGETFINAASAKTLHFRIANSDIGTFTSTAFGLSTNIQRTDHNLGHLVGGYNNLGANDSKTNPIYSIGSGYTPTATSKTGWYGCGYSHTNTGFMPSGASGWGFYVVGNGTVNAFIGDSGASIVGAITATGNVTAYYSDERLKTRLGLIDGALAKVKSLDGFYFEANETAQALGYEKKREVGVSAQQVEAILPEIIAPAPIDPQYKTLDYAKLVPLLIEAIKELSAEVDQLKSQLNK